MLSKPFDDASSMHNIVLRRTTATNSKANQKRILCNNQDPINHGNDKTFSTIIHSPHFLSNQHKQTQHLYIKHHLNSPLPAGFLSLTLRPPFLPLPDGRNPLSPDTSEAVYPDQGWALERHITWPAMGRSGQAHRYVKVCQLTSVRPSAMLSRRRARHPVDAKSARSWTSRGHVARGTAKHAHTADG